MKTEEIKKQCNLIDTLKGKLDSLNELEGMALYLCPGEDAKSIFDGIKECINITKNQLNEAKAKLGNLIDDDEDDNESIKRWEESTLQDLRDGMKSKQKEEEPEGPAKWRDQLSKSDMLLNSIRNSGLSKADENFLVECLVKVTRPIVDKIVTASIQEDCL